MLKGQTLTITASSLTRIDRYDDLTLESVTETVVSDRKIRSALRTNRIAGFRTTKRICKYTFQHF